MAETAGPLGRGLLFGLCAVVSGTHENLHSIQPSYPQQAFGSAQIWLILEPLSSPCWVAVMCSACC